MRMEKIEIARQIARRHITTDPDVREVFLLEASEHEEDDPEEPIKLLEIVEGTPEVGVEPVGFAPNPHQGVPYPMLIVDLSPRELEANGLQELRFGETIWRITEQLVRVSEAA